MQKMRKGYEMPEKQPPGGRNRHSINLADLAKPAKESQKQHWTKNTDPTPQNDDTNSRDSDCAACLTHHTGQRRKPPTTSLLKRNPHIALVSPLQSRFLVGTQPHFGTLYSISQRSGSK